MTTLEYLIAAEKADKRLSLRTKEACDLLGCGKSYLYDLRKQGFLQSFKDGIRRRYLTQSLYAYLKAQVGR